jgi:hypothetical protein
MIDGAISIAVSAKPPDLQDSAQRKVLHVARKIEARTITLEKSNPTLRQIGAADMLHRRRLPA